MQTLLLDTNSVIKKLEQRGFSRAQAEGMDALKELDASSLVTKTNLELALARTTTTIINVDDGSIVRAGRAYRRPHPVLQIVPNSDEISIECRALRVEGSTQWMAFAELLIISSSGSLETRVMTWKHCIIAAAVGCGLAIIAAGAQSAPLGSAARGFGSAAAAGPGFENVGYRRAYRYRARRAYGYRAYGFRRRSIEYANPNMYSTGSRAWWAVMNRQGRGGRPD
jgi:hypothetical protein